MKKIFFNFVSCLIALIMAFAMTPGACQAATETAVQKLAKDNNSFAFNLYSQLKTQKGNIFFSPYSISTALSMTYAGAKGNTEKEMAKALNFKMPQPELHKSFFEMSKSLKALQQKGIEINTANALWLQKDYKLLKTFTDCVNKYYGGGINLVDFKKATETARKQINAWVEKQTKNKIKDLIKPDILKPSTKLVLTNAIYFKGNWESQFKKAYTKSDKFHLSKDKTVDVPFMTQNTHFNYLEENDFQMIQLPYAGKKLSMIIILPDKIDGLAGIESKINSTNINDWISKLRSSKVDLYLPRFKTTAEFSLADKLKALGMQDAFTDRADFSGMSGSKDLFIAAVIHKAFVDVNEEGTEAAAATAVVMQAKSVEMKKTFKADHAFLFFIKDNTSGNILFMGRILDPTK